MVFTAGHAGKRKGRWGRTRHFGEQSPRFPQRCLDKTLHINFNWKERALCGDADARGRNEMQSRAVSVVLSVT